ncbi:MAG: hypothetical protein M1835_000117 [Candelina submexicana]|nr:MAG: hypothetical protein M1835_000117 [Candelina submexicana]
MELDSEDSIRSEYIKKEPFQSNALDEHETASPYLALMLGPNEVRVEIGQDVMARCETLTSLLEDGDLLGPPTPDDPIIKVYLPNDSPWAFSKLVEWITHGECPIDVFSYYHWNSGRVLLRAPRTIAEEELANAAAEAWALEENCYTPKSGVLPNTPAWIEAEPPATHEVFRHMVELYSLADYFYIVDLRTEVSSYLRKHFDIGPKEVIVMLERLGPLLEDPRDHRHDADEESRELYELIIASFVQYSDLLQGMDGLRDLKMTNDHGTRTLLHACQSAERVEYEWGALSSAMEEGNLLFAERDVEGERLLDTGSCGVHRGDFVLLLGTEGSSLIGINAKGHLGRFDAADAFRKVAKGAWV